MTHPQRLLLSAALLANVATAGAESFTIVALPDTQNYANNASNAPLFTQQTQWIADQIQTGGNPRNIQFVTHLGDVVSSGSSLTQWNRADASMDVLDNVVKYSVLPGNHDYASTGNKSTDTANYVNLFGPTRFASYDWYGGADPSGNNSFQRFSAGGYDFLHLALEWRPTINSPFRDPSPIAWAQSVIDANPNTPVILSTHEYIDDSPPGRGGTGDALWDDLVRRNDQIFLVLNGHNHGAGGLNDGEYHQVSTNDAGRPVYEVLQDYQDYPNGGDGWLRLINFDIGVGQIQFETYSPVLDEFQTERTDTVGPFASQFEFDVDFADRLVPIILPPDPNDTPRPPDFLFQQGIAGYGGTLDKELRSSGDDSSNGQNDLISVDGDDGPGTAPNHALIRFEDIIGAEAGQLPPGASIESAKLVLDVVNPGSGFNVHEVLIPWDESSTWTGFGAGVQPNSVEAEAIPIDSFGANNSSSNVDIGELEIDVTDTIRDYLAGARINHGWALLPFPAGTNGIDFHTSEFADPSVRPALVIDTLDGDYDLDGDVDLADYDRWVAQFGTTGPALADGNRDGVVDIADYTVWRDALPASPAAVPEPISLTLALVGLTALNRAAPRSQCASASQES